MQTASPKEHATMAGLTPALVAILLWCTTGISYVSSIKRIGALPFVAIICLLGAITIITFRLVRGEPVVPLFKLPRRVLLIGFFGITVYKIILSLAFQYATMPEIGQVNLINYLWPILIVIFGFIWLHQSARPLPAVCGILLGFAGILVSRGLSTELWKTPASLIPHAMALCAAGLWALYSVMLRRWQVPEEKSGTACQFLICSLTAALLAGWRGEWHLAPYHSASLWGWLLWCGIGPVGLAFYAWELAIKRGNVPLIATLSYFIPIGSSLLISLLFRETMKPSLFIGAALIAGGAWLMRLAVRPTRGASS